MKQDVVKLLGNSYMFKDIEKGIDANKYIKVIDKCIKMCYNIL